MAGDTRSGCVRGLQVPAEHFANPGKDRVKPLCTMCPENNLEMLMVRYQEGDIGAARELIDRLSPQLHRLFLGQFASRESADDLLQETWLRIHRVRHTYRAGEPVLPWFYAIARHVRVDHYRKASRTTGREQRLAETPEVAAPPVNSDRTADLEELLAPLPESQREVIRDVEGRGNVTGRGGACHCVAALGQ